MNLIARMIPEMAIEWKMGTLVASKHDVRLTRVVDGKLAVGKFIRILKGQAGVVIKVDRHSNHEKGKTNVYLVQFPAGDVRMSSSHLTRVSDDSEMKMSRKVMDIADVDADEFEVPVENEPEY